IRVGDPVIVTRNGKELNVSNGERGTVTAIDASGSISVDLAGHGGPVVFRDWARKDLELAYAITGHKSQGNQAPVVIVALPEPSTPNRPSRMAYREWLYTALTRAERQAYLVGDPEAIKECIANPRGEARRTGLAPLLKRSLRDHDPTRPAASPITAHPATPIPSPLPPGQAVSPAAVTLSSLPTPPREELTMPTEATTRTTAPVIDIYTDGGYSPNPGASSYGYVLSYADGRLVEGRGGFPDPGASEPGGSTTKGQTSNRMELQAAIAALRQVPSGRDHPVRVHPHAQYVQRSMKEWLPKWESNGWKKSNGDDVENRDLWEELATLARERTITWEWVKGQGGDPLNKRCHELVQMARKELRGGQGAFEVQDEIVDGHTTSSSPINPSTGKPLTAGPAPEAQRVASGVESPVLVANQGDNAPAATREAGEELTTSSLPPAAVQTAPSSTPTSADILKNAMTAAMKQA
ncbi:MAG TPA: RNase H family protein, partial [Chloroflexota bacterium]|nr:RNase H family protein [Chloroflexota bacterium]